MDESLDDATRERVREHVLASVHPDRREAEVVAVEPTAHGARVGVKAHPRGYLSTAKYALVTVDADGKVTAAEACTGRELRADLDADWE